MKNDATARQLDDTRPTSDVMHGPSDGTVHTGRVSDGAAIQFNNVYFRRKGAATDALKNISFLVKEGSFTAVIGPNGAGKSTLLRMLISPPQQREGTIELFGQSFSIHDQKLKKLIGYVPQGDFLDNYSTVKENLLFQLKLTGVDLKFTTPYVTQLVDTLGLSSILKNRIYSLSGGQKRRVSLAMGLIHKPKILILDEPTNALDNDIKNEFWRSLRPMAENFKLTVIFSSHNLPEVQSNAANLLILNSGNQIGFFPTDSFIKGHGTDSLHLEIVGSGGDNRLIWDKIGNILPPDNILFQDDRRLIAAFSANPEVKWRETISKGMDALLVNDLKITWSPIALEDCYLKLFGAKYAAQR